MALLYIYHDYTHHNAPLWFALNQRYELRLINAYDIHNGVLAEKPDAFIMPGGASRYAGAQLQGLGNSAIKNYVAGGGNYIGICGGAYYACARTQWQHGQQHFDVSYDLNLCAATATGPITAFCDGVNTARLVTLQAHSTTVPSLYWGGPQFINLPATATVLACYAALTENSAAVIAGPYQAGRYMLFSPHTEYDHAALALMRVPVIESAYADFAALPDTHHLNLDFFHKTLDDFLG